MGTNNGCVCIILVNYNGYKDTVECVKSILECKYSNYKIIIVDNASKDAILLKADKWLNDNAEIVYAKENNGFSEGNNIGIEYAQKYSPDYILLLNNDTVVIPGFIEKLLAPFDKDTTVAITTGIINYYYDKKSCWYNFGSYSKLTGYTRMLGNYKGSEPKEVGFSTGCLMMISNSFIEKYGALSEDYFLYSEDTEYCLRVNKNGYKIVSVPEVLIYHKVNASTGTGSKMQQYYLVRNYLQVIKKYGSVFPLAYVFRFLLSVYEIMRYHYDYKIIKLAFTDFKNGVTGKVDYFS